VSTATAGVTPANGWTKGAFTSTSNTGNFILSNPDVVGHTYVLDCLASVNIVCPTAPLTTQVLTAGQSVNMGVGYSINSGASGNGWIQLVVNSNELAPGKLNFKIWPNVAHAVSVTSGTSPSRGSFTNGFTQVYTVRNVGTSSDTYTFTCLAPANVTCGTVSPGSMTRRSSRSPTIPGRPAQRT
jgi:hypothetical protein